MKIARRLEDAAEFAPSAVTIGNFDGVHAGHRHLFQEVVCAARESGARATVLTFDPHPARVVAPQRAPRLLTSVEDRCALMAQCGIEQVLILPFDAELARWSPEDFVRRVLVETLGARVILVGDNFRFGHKQSGDTELLAALGARFGFATQVAGAVRMRGRVVSSSEVRRLVESGDVGMACRFLLRPYALVGDVVHGHGVGSRQVVPTLNLRVAGEVLPRRGVYITRTRDLDSARAWQSITNIGHRPTFGGDGELSIETFLLSPFDGETPARIRLEFLRRVREEKKFESAEALKAQVMRDVSRARAYFRRITSLKTASIQ
jgi:riboflavin kinase/FMN adenylyltransferase